MAHKVARSLLFLATLLLGVSLITVAAPPRPAPAAPPHGERTVYLGGDLSDENLVTFSATVAATGQPATLLLDMPASSKYLKAFLSAYRPDAVIPVGSFPENLADVDHRLGIHARPPLAWKRGRPTALWKALFPQAERVVVCPAEPRGLLLQAACLAGVMRAPLFVSHGTAADEADLRRWTGEWQTRDIYAIAGTSRICRELHNVRIHRLADEDAVMAAYLRHQLRKGPIRTLVVANPSDTNRGLGSMSGLAPWVTLQKRAALLLTNAEGKNTASVVRRALKNPHLQQADVLLLLADLRAIPMDRRLNPIEGKDTHIEMEPLTPTGTEPFSFATGRLFNEDPGVVALVLARQKCLETLAPASRRKVLVASNPGGSLPLLETFSRYTARELHNCGYETTARFGNEVNGDEVRRLLPEHDIFLWEGHHSTLVKDYKFTEWNEPLPPAFIFLQSCLALTEAKAQPLLQRGAIGVVGSSTRTYSASGGAFSLAFFDALLYDQQSLGGSMRQAKNFLLAYSLLKEKRLGKEARLGGANVRSAWAFSLWGDPTLKLPAPAPRDNRLDAVRHHVHGDTITVHLPESAYEPITSAHYQARMRPNARMAGLISKEPDERRRLVPFVFVEVPLPKAPPGRTPRVQSRLPDAHWVFCWDQRRRCGYLLITPRPRDQRELRFHIAWDSIETVEANY